MKIIITNLPLQTLTNSSACKALVKTLKIKNIPKSEIIRKRLRHRCKNTFERLLLEKEKTTVKNVYEQNIHGNIWKMLLTL